jgi:hypothetical protein
MFQLDLLILVLDLQPIDIPGSGLFDFCSDGGRIDRLMTRSIGLTCANKRSSLVVLVTCVRLRGESGCLHVPISGVWVSLKP